MKTLITIISLILFVSACSTKAKKYNYIKIISVEKADSINDYNKGLAVGTYFYYNPQSDSTLLRSLRDRDSFTIITYTGRLGNQKYVDTLDMLLTLLLREVKEPKAKRHCFQPTDYCNPYYYVEYNDSKGSHFIPFPTRESDTLYNFMRFLYRLPVSSWGKTLIENNTIDQTEELVKMFKGLGIYDSIVKIYSPLPCIKGINMKKLYGSWRTIGDEHNDHTLKYTINQIDSTGNWTMYRIDRKERELRYSAKIVSIKGHIIKLKGDAGPASLQILNLTDNCLEYRVGKTNNTWRFDRMK